MHPSLAYVTDRDRTLQETPFVEGKQRLHFPNTVPMNDTRPIPRALGSVETYTENPAGNGRCITADPARVRPRNTLALARLL